MIKIKLAADIFLTAAWIVVIALGAVLRDWALVGISVAAALIFINLAWYDIIKLDRELPKYIISLGGGSYYNGRGGATYKAKAKAYRSRRAANKAANKIAYAQQGIKLPSIEEVQSERVHQD